MSARSPRVQINFSSRLIKPLRSNPWRRSWPALASTRVALATTLAEHGMHLLLEKPLGHDLTGVVPLLDLCRVRRLTLMTGYNLRFSPSLREAKHLIESGFVGHILGARAEVGQYLPDWRPGSDYRSLSAPRVLWVVAFCLN